MAFTTILKEQPLRILFPKTLWEHAGFGSENIATKCYIVCNNDTGTEFDVFIEEPEINIDWVINADCKRRLGLSTFTKGVKPGDTFRITARKGCIHVKKVDFVSED